MKNQNLQVEDYIELLELMMKDLKNVPNEYQPTNYWKVYENRFLTELYKKGLYDFRRRKKSVLSSFGATDISVPLGKIDLNLKHYINNSITRKIPLYGKIIGAINTILNNIMPVTIPYNMNLKGLKEVVFDYVELKGEIQGVSLLKDIDCSLKGNPEDVFEMYGKYYTISNLYYYLRYIYCANHIDFNRINVLVELGSGAGKQVEIIKKMFPHITYFAFDVPPQLYVCEQYLKSVFPKDVISFRETRLMESLDDVQKYKGKILLFGNWKIPIIEKLNVDLFWNAASFQEMEPEIVANYLKYVNNCSKYVYLQQLMEGKNIASRKGRYGVLKQTKLEDYEKGLNNYNLINMEDSIGPFGKIEGYKDSIWIRR